MGFVDHANLAEVVAVNQKIHSNVFFSTVINHVNRAVALDDEEKELFSLALLDHHFLRTGEESRHKAVDCSDKDHVVDVVVVIKNPLN